MRSDCVPTTGLGRVRKLSSKLKILGFTLIYLRYFSSWIGQVVLFGSIVQLGENFEMIKSEFREKKDNFERIKSDFREKENRVGMWTVDIYIIYR